MVKHQNYKFLSLTYIALFVLILGGCDKNASVPEGTHITDAGQGDPIELVQTYAQGEYRMIIENNLTQHLTGQGLNQKHKMNQKFSLALSVSESDSDQIKTVYMVYDTIEQYINMGGVSMDYNSRTPPGSSATPAEREMHKLLSPMLGADDMPENYVPVFMRVDDC